MLYFWIIILLLSAAIELITSVTLVSIWFVAGSIVSIILNLLNFNTPIQVIGFIASSIIFFVCFKPLLKKFIHFDKVPTNYDRYIGNTYSLLEPINDNPGLIKINDMYWSALSENNIHINKDELVEILRFEGSKVIVRRV